MKQCPKCGAQLKENARFCPKCGSEYRTTAPSMRESAAEVNKTDDAAENPLIGDKNLINESTIIGKQEKYEASNITIHNTVTEDHSHTTVVCAVSGKRVYLDHSVVCPECGKPVAMEYYEESSKRCEKCEEKAREAFRAKAASITAEGPLDKVRKQRLDDEARKLRIDSATQTAILRTLQTKSRSADGKLSSLQEAELETAVKQLMQPDITRARKALESLSVLHELTGNYVADYWYFLGQAITSPEEFARSYEEEVTDNYWQRYWGYLAYCIMGSPKGSAAVERLRNSFGEHEDDIRLAETSYCMARGFATFDRSMIKHAGEMATQIHPEFLSKPLVPVHTLLNRILAEDIQLDGKYSGEEIFIIIQIFRAGGYIQHMQAEAEARERQEREARERQEQEIRETRERQERERLAAEEARRQKQAELSAERSRRMEEEVARLSGKSPKTGDVSRTKEFAGYETTVLPEKKKGGWKRTVLIILCVLIVILIALFLIPAPESLQ